MYSCTNYKAAISLTSWVCAHERFATVMKQLGQPFFRCAPPDDREMSNLHATQSQILFCYNIMPPIWQ
jgi:hypothetical protein